MIALSIVIPVFNEGDRIVSTAWSWSREVTRLGIEHEVLIYDDGSTDATPVALGLLARECPAVQVRRHENRGHGPTILRGYSEARGDWILQIDADDEVGTAAFEGFWSHREGVDFLIGRREGRQLGLGRRILSRGASLAVRAWFGGRVVDVNSPYRLMRRTALSPMLARIAPDTFAPNVVITGLAIRDGCRVVERRVNARADPERRPGWNAARAALLAFRQLRETARRQGRGTTR